MKTRRATAALSAMALLAAAAAVVVSPSANAAGGQGVWGTWTRAVNTGSLTVPAMNAATPSATWTSNGGSLSLASSAFLNASTPVGAVYGTSRGSQYVYQGTASGSSTSVTTYTFASNTTVGNWAFVLGDIDADKVKVEAVTSLGGAATAAELGFQSVFNYCVGSPQPSSCGVGPNTDIPAWNSGTQELVGNGIDTNGASGWFQPTVSLRSLTLTFTKASGFPVYQTWFVGDPVADLALTKSTVTTNPVAGQEVSFKLSMSNLGVSTAQAPITVTDTLPAGVSFAQVEPSNSPGWFCYATGQVVTCTNNAPVLAGNAAPDLYLIGVLGADTGLQTITNTATASSATLDVNTDNNTASSTVTPAISTDLAIAKLTSAFTAGTTGSYTMTATNNGPSSYTGPVVITDTLPLGITYAGPDPSGWVCVVTTSGGVSTQEVVQCTLTGGNLAVAATKSLLLPVAVGAGVTTPVLNSATVNTPATDAISANNTATSQSVVGVQSDLSISKYLSAPVSPQLPIAGSAATFTLTAFNSGPSNNPGPIVVSDALPTGMTFVSAGNTDWSCSAAGTPELVTCTHAAALANSASSSFPINVTLDGTTSGQPLTNVAVVTGPDETDISNNSTSVVVTPIQATLQVVKSIPSGNEMRTQPVVLSIDCPGAPGTWPVTLTVPVGANSGTTGNIPLHVASVTCTISETDTGGSASVPPIGTITPTFNGGSWPVGTTKALMYGHSANVAATASSAPIGVSNAVTTTTASPCSLSGGALHTASGTGTCTLHYSAAGTPAITASTTTSVTQAPTDGCGPGLRNWPRTCITYGSSPSVSVTINTNDPATAHPTVTFSNNYTHNSPVITTTRTVQLVKAPIPLTPTAVASTTPIKRSGSTTLVSSAATAGLMSAQVRCAPVTKGITRQGDLRYCGWSFNSTTGKLVVYTRGYANVVVIATIRSAPHTSQATNYRTVVWTRTWRVS